MIENITVVDKNGNGIFAEGIAYTQFLFSGKKYILYTMNERCSDNRIKMYVGELTDTVGSLEKIPDDEWAKVSDYLRAISDGEQNINIKFLRMNNATFNIGIPRKLAITPEVKQVFKDCQRKGVLASQQQQMEDVPAIETSTGDSFKKEEMSQTPAFVSPTEANQDQMNIFNNSIKPEVVPMQTAAGVINNGEVQQESMQMAEGMMPQQPTMVQPQYVPAPSTLVNQFENQSSNIPTQLTENNIFSGDNTANDVAMALETASVNNSDDYIQFQQGLATNISNDLGVATGISYKDNDKEVTKEEALEALETLNRYFKNTKELPSSLASELITQTQEPKIENNELIQQVPLPETSLSTEGLVEYNDDSQTETLTSQEGMDTTNSGIVQDQGRTLSLVPEGIPSVAPVAVENSGYIVDNTNIQDMNYQSQNMGGQIPEAPMIEQNDAFDTQLSQVNQIQQGYVASTNGPAVNMNTTPANISDVPVTLPDNYNSQAVANSNVVMGPGSLTTENLTKAA